ncbi:MAG: hypothetical protein AB7I19_03070 [Planctomycetota bacterium]
MNATRQRAISLIAVGLAATLVGVRTLDGGWLSDDVMLGFFLRHDVDAVAIDWPRVFADFVRPWLGIELPLYRPMVSVSLASDLELGGGAPWAFHLTNLLLHVTASMLVALLADALMLRRRALASALAGGWFAVHPIAIEPIAWIAARNSSLELVLHLATTLAFARYLRDGRRLARAAVPACAVLALATKESAIVLPASLFAVDWLVRPHFPLSLRLRPHLKLLPLWFGYVLLRFGLGLGLGAGDANTATPARFELAQVGAKLRALVAPELPSLSPLWSLPAAALAALVLAVLLRRRTRALVVLSGWVAVHLAPTLSMPLHAGLSGGRLLYGAVVPLALAVGCAAAVRAKYLAPCAILVFASWILGGQRIVDRYRAAWLEMEQLRAALDEHGRDVEVGRPLVLTAATPIREGLPPFNHNGWFALAQRPLAERPFPIVSAGFVSTPAPGALDLYHDGSALRALLDHGCSIATWDSANARLLLRRRSGASRTSVALTRDPARSSRWRFAAPVAAEDYALVTLIAPTSAESGTLRWLSAAGELPGELAGLDFAVPASGAVELDLTRALGPPSLATFGIQLEGIEVRFDSDGEARDVEAHPSLGEIALPLPYDGAVLELDAASAMLLTTSATATAPQRTIVVTPMGAVSLRNDDPDAERALGRALRTLSAASSDTSVLFWRETVRPLGEGGNARSRVDWFTLAR